MLRDSNDMVFQARSDFEYTKDPSGTTYKISNTIPHGRMANLAEQDTITIGPLAKCARHDIILPGYIKTHVIILGKCSNHHICPRFKSD